LLLAWVPVRSSVTATESTRLESTRAVKLLTINYSGVRGTREYQNFSSQVTLLGDVIMSETAATAPVTAVKRSFESIVASLSKDFIRTDLPEFRTGDSIRVHAKIVEGTKERVQVFEGVVLKRSNGKQSDATFTVRKVSYNIGVERTFPLHSPRIEKIEVVSRAKVRRSRLFYLRSLRGKATRMKTLFDSGAGKAAAVKAD
jgi:large subunit ribosomal protein L19